MVIGIWLLLLLLSGFLAWKLLDFLLIFLQQHKLTHANYRGIQMPGSLGIYIWAVLLLYVAGLRLINRMYALESELLWQTGDYLIALSVIFFVGWLDDTAGDKNIKGLVRHWRELYYHHRLSTGMLKALVTGAVATGMVWSLGHSPWISFFVLLNLLLTTNTLNLLDVRPGRAIKAAWLLILLFAGVASFSKLWLLAPIGFSLLLLFPYDLQERLMLGDSGANMIGFALGYYLAVAAPFWFHLLWLPVLLAFQWFADQYSFSKVIEGNRVLHWLDRLGRQK